MADPFLALARHLPSKSRCMRALAVCSKFFLGQGALQSVQLISGFLLVRWLTIEAWAQYGLASGLQLTMATLMDLGISSTIVPLIGENVHDNELMGRYVRAAVHLRKKSFWILTPITCVLFFAMAQRHHWGMPVVFLLLASIVIALFASGYISCYSPPFFVSGRLSEFYRPQTFSAFLRLILFAICWVAGVLNAWIASAVYAFTSLINGYLLRHGSRKYLTWPERDSASVDREVLQYILPAAPAIIFSAFQLQISLFLVSFFGNTYAVAQIAALGKLGQLFAVLTTFCVVIVEPFVARLSRERLFPIYAKLMILSILLASPIVFVAFAWPSLPLWVLGPNYANLQALVGWIVLAWCINSIAGLMWIMNRARKWLFWRGSFFEIVVLLGVQVIFVLAVGVRTTREAVFFTLVSSLCYLASHAYVAVIGFGRQREDALA